MTAPRFPMTYCSQCGAEQGPGDAGVSHCADHRARTEAAPVSSTSEWTMIGPDGTRFTGPTPFKAASTANRHRVQTDPAAAKQFADMIESVRSENEAENERLLAEHGTLNCPACGGSGHVGDVAAEAPQEAAQPLRNLQTWLTCRLIGNAASPSVETVKAWIAALSPLTGDEVPAFVQSAQEAAQGQAFAWAPESFDWRDHQSEQTIKLTRNSQPAHGFTQPLYTALAQKAQPAQAPSGAVLMSEVEVVERNGEAGTCSCNLVNGYTPFIGDRLMLIATPAQPTGEAT